MNRFWIVGAFLGLILMSWIWSAVATALALNALNNREWSSAISWAQAARPPISIWSTVSFHQLASLELWRLGLDGIELGGSCIPTLNLADHLGGDQIGSSTPSLPTCAEQGTQLLQVSSVQMKKSWLLKPWLESHHLPQAASAGSNWLSLATEISQRHLKVVILLQNPHELRATGGFMGSYAVVDLDHGSAKSLAVHDIYEADGQFKGYVEPPAGVAEYLSGGKGWRLPDANWDVEYPTSARRILDFLALGGEKDIDVLVALNLSVAEDVLQQTGQIPLPDYNVVITADNLADVARADRSTFFPGSQQKPHFLSHMLHQTQAVLLQLPPPTQLRLLERMWQRTRSRDILVYSPDEELQKLWQQHRLSGEINTRIKGASLLFLYPVESNVGINKVNRHVTRTITLTQTSTNTSTLTINWRNTSPTEAYINYFRLVTEPMTTILTGTYGGQPLVLNNARSNLPRTELYTQTGMLLEVPPNASRELTLNLNHPPLREGDLVFFDRQPGLPLDTPFTLNSNGKSITIPLDQNLSQAL